jgi:hypothetical protein
MKHRKLFLLLCLLHFLIANIKAQSPNFKASEELEDSRSLISLFLNNDEVVFYGTNLSFANLEGMDIYMFRYKSSDLTRVGNRTSVSKFLRSNKVFEKRFSYDDKQIIFYSNKAKSNGELMLSYQITENSSSKGGETKEINLGVKKWDKGRGIPTTAEIVYSEEESDYNFEDILMSKNKDKFLYVDNIEDKDAGKVSRVISINAQTMQIEKEMTFDLGITRLGIGGIYHNDFLYSIVEVDPGNEANENNYYKLIALSLNKEVKSFIYDIKFEGKTVENCGFDIAPNGDVLIAGVSSNEPHKHYQNYLDEIFFRRLDGTTGKLITESDIKPDFKTIQFLTGKPNSANVERVKGKYRVVKFFPLSNGSMNIIMEDTYPDNSTDFCQTLLVSNIKQNGEFNWLKYIPKMQEKGDFSSNHISYSHRIDGNKLTLIYMDNKNNYDSKTNLLLPDKLLSFKNVKVASKSNIGMAMVTIDETGTLLKN